MENKKQNQVVEYINENLSGVIRCHQKSENTLIGLPKPYTVPCVSEMFQEMYYWDTYFTNIGLILSGHIEQAKNNVEDIAYLIKKYGFMPNGNRTYFLNRSQPPFFSKMVSDVFEATKDMNWLKEMYDAACIEYAFWKKNRMTVSGLNCYGGMFESNERRMEYAGKLCTRFSIEMPLDKELLERYGDCFIAYAESGWDCTSRFKFNAQDHNWLDLNALLYGMEKDLEYFAGLLDNGEENKWKQKAIKRSVLMNELMWNEKKNMFCDYNFVKMEKSDFLSAAVFYPLYVGMATEEQAKKIYELLPNLECAYGVACSQDKDLFQLQWDYPHGWACIQYIIIKGLLNYGYKEAAERIARKYLTTVETNFEKTGAIWEKYNMVTGSVSVTKEYESPKMLGWSAGTYLYCINMLEIL